MKFCIRLFAVFIVVVTIFPIGAYCQQQRYAPVLFFNIDNDFLNISFRSTDMYYSSGLRLGFSDKIYNRNILDKAMVSFPNDSSRIRAIYVEHIFQTPQEVATSRLQVGDYPYVALFTMDYGNRSLYGSYSVYSLLTVGVQGPMARGEELQTYLHKHVFKSNVPLGWDNQLPNDIALAYKVGLDKMLYKTDYLEVIGNAEVNFGTLYNNMVMGAKIRLGRFNSYFSTSSWVFDKADKRLHVYLTLQPYIKMVQGNSLLEGGPLHSAGSKWGEPNSKYYHIDRSDLERLIFGYSWTFHLDIGSVGVSYSENFYSSEIKGLNGHAYGSFILTFRL